MDAPPETVLALLRDTARAAKRSALPPALRKGTRGLRGRVRGTRFTVAVDEIFDGDDTRLHGWVAADGDGATRVRASVVPARNTDVLVLGLLAFAGVYSLAGLKGGWWIVVVALVLGALGTVRNVARLMNHDHPAFLVQWLHAVLDGLPSASPAPAVNGARPLPHPAIAAGIHTQPVRDTP